jgi:hypothetical protein
MSYDLTYDATSIAVGWANLGVPLPKALTTAIETFETLQYVDIIHRPTIDLEGLTAENAEKRLAVFAAELTTSLPLSSGLPGAMSISILAEAKTRAMTKAAGAVLAAAGNAVPEVIGSLEPTFTRAVDEFRESVALLPDELTAQTLVTAGAATLDAYQSAVASAAVIERIDAWLGTVGRLSNFADHLQRPILRTLEPKNRSEYFELAQERDSLRLPGHYVAAVRLNVPFKMSTPAECSEVWERIESAPVPERPYRLQTV